MGAIWQDLWESREHDGESLALQCGEQSLSCRAFFHMIRQAEAGLRACGVQAGELVTILSLNTPETIAAFYAIDRIGAVANWVDMKLSPAEVESYLCRAQSKVVLVLELAFSKVYENRGSAPAKAFIVLPLAPYVSPALTEKLGLGTWPDRSSADCVAWTEFLRSPVEASPDEIRWEDAAVITYTGGTTGPAKGVTLSRRAFHTSLTQYTQAKTEYGKGGTCLTLLPPFAAFGLCQCVHIPLCLGMTVILAPLFRPDQLGKFLIRYRPEQVCGTTSYWQLLLRSEAVSQADLSFLRNPRNGGDAMSLEMERRVNQFLSQRGCPAKLIQEYGMSEVSGIVCLQYGSTHKVGTVGRPLPGCQILAVNPDTGQVLPSGEQGELLIQSHTVMNGYYGQPQADDQVLKPGPDGTLWVWTKDMGCIELDGSVKITGRKKRMLSRNGFKIFPSVIENCLLGNPLVAECAVVGGESSGGETLPVAHVVLHAGIRPEEAEKNLRIWCREKLNQYLIPVSYRFRKELPLTARGKLDYRTLEQETRL